MNKLSFQDIILKLQDYWKNYGCLILQSYDLPVGAATFHPATIFRCLDTKPWYIAYVQSSRRPTDSRYGNHPNRLHHYYQFQVLLKPSPDNIQELYLSSLEYLGIDLINNDVRFIEDDWESPTLGASGLGWEIWFNGMEISQFTYMQQVGSILCNPIPGEITYGLERIALQIQGVDLIQDINWSYQKLLNRNLKYNEIDCDSERQFSKFNIELADTSFLLKNFEDSEKYCNSLLSANLPLPAYDYCIIASHVFNLLNSRGVLSITERASYIIRVRDLAKKCCFKWLDLQI